MTTAEQTITYTTADQVVAGDRLQTVVRGESQIVTVEAVTVLDTYWVGLDLIFGTTGSASRIVSASSGVAVIR